MDKDIFLTALDSLANANLGFAVVLAYLTMGIFAHLIYMQAIEYIVYKDYLKTYRLLILIAFTVTFIALIPVSIYLTYRYLDIPSESIRNLAAVAGRIGPFATGIAFELIYLYRRKGNNLDNKE